MKLLNWMGEHPVLTVILLLVLDCIMWDIVKLARSY